MIILDTDILSLIQREDSPAGVRVRTRIAQIPNSVPVVTTVVSYEEQTHGWFAAMSNAQARRDVEKELKVYAELIKHLANYRKTNVVTYDRRAADRLSQLKSMRLRIGTNDLKIAAITLSLDATLISRNLVDFKKVPGLRVEDWAQG